MKTSYRSIAAYVTKDGSEIRELMHPDVHGNVRQSLAEAIIQPRQKTQLHRHLMSEELYHVTQGTGIMSLGETSLLVGAGDTVHIAPGVAHCVQATGESPLHILCCCSPAYSHEDTEML